MTPLVKCQESTPFLPGVFEPDRRKLIALADSLFGPEGYFASAAWQAIRNQTHKELDQLFDVIREANAGVNPKDVDSGGPCYGFVESCRRVLKKRHISWNYIHTKVREWNLRPESRFLTSHADWHTAIEILVTLPGRRPVSIGFIDAGCHHSGFKTGNRGGWDHIFFPPLPENFHTIK